MQKQPAKVNYFFGKAWKLPFQTIAGAFKRAGIHIADSAIYCFTSTIDFIKAFIALVFSIFRVDFSDIWDCTKETVVALFVFSFALPNFVFVLFLIPTFCIVLSALQMAVFLAMMLVIYVTFTLVFFIDWLYRRMRHISSTCEQCQAKTALPIYTCPRCGVKHTSLIPSKYGIFKRECECGAKLATTFLNGREAIDAECPTCGNSIRDGGKHIDIPIPVVGGPSAGKTCLIHMAIDSFEKNAYSDHGLNFEYSPNEDDEYSMNMSYLNSGNVPMKTSDMRLRFYRFYMQPEKKIKHLVSLCDVGGEVYDNSEALGEQRGLTHSKAFIMVIDPLSIENYRKELEENIDIAKYGPSEKAIDEVVSMLISTLENMCNLSDKDMLNRDLAIVFSKSDIPGLDEKIGEEAVSDYMASHAGTTRLQAQNAVCEQFLREYEEDDFINSIKSKFKSVQYFACSALGHNADGQKFVPNGVTDPIYWILDKNSPQYDLSKYWGEKI